MTWTLLHARGMPADSFLGAWHLDPMLWAGLTLAAGAYLLAWRAVRRQGRYRLEGWHAVAYAGGIVSLVVALLGPLDAFNDEVFLVHMLQHVVLMLVAAPLMLLGRPVQLALRAIPVRQSGRVLRRVLHPGWVRGLLTVVTNPFVVFVIFNVNLVVWHLPGLYEAALENDLIHDLEHVTFFGTALLLWWIVIDPVPRHHRLASHWAILLLFASGAVSDLLGMTLLLSRQVHYGFYTRVINPWGLSPLADQRLAGLIMFAGGVLATFGAVFLLLSRSTRPVPARRVDEPVKST